MFKNIGLESSWGCKRMQGAAVKVDAVGEQQPKRTQAASMQQQLKAGAIGEQQLEADANGKQQMKRMQLGQGAAADSKRMQTASSS